jgi:hypothetical protein
MAESATTINENGTHSAWAQDVITEWGHEVLVANPRLMEGSKRRMRKSDRIDANRIRPDRDWFAHSLVPSHTYGSCRLIAYVSRENLRCDFGKSTPMAQKTPNPNAAAVNIALH